MSTANPIDIDLPNTGFMRLSQVLSVISIGKTTWYSWIKEGKAPEPVYLTPKAPRWKVQDIRKLIHQIEHGNQD